VIARAAAALGSWKAAAFWLERRVGEYAATSRLDLTVDDNRTGLEALPDDEVDELLDQLRARRETEEARREPA
jgi:hypothetical protein